MTAFNDHEQALKLRVDEVLPGVLSELENLVSIPSISSLTEHDADVEATAERIVELVTELGCEDVRIVREDGKPAVIARFPAPDGQPTVCLYAHHDVQPVGEVSAWTSDPFTATRRGDRLFGRGAADDKGGFAVHLAALRAFDGKPPVGVTLFIEGEEEIGSPSLHRIIERHRDLLDADLFVIADSVNWDVNAPAFTTTLRGLADCVVEVSTLDHALHSGQYGGVVPDALTALVKLLATLHDDVGNVAVEGLATGSAAELVYPHERLIAESGLLEGVELIGEGSVVERMWAKPAITVLAIDAPTVAEASNTLQPSARAKISLRVAPGDDADAALVALSRHLETHAPWGAQVTVSAGETGQPGVIPFEGRASEVARSSFADAWQVEPTFVGCGGSIPMVAAFQEAFPQASVVVSAVTDPDSRMHGIDESLHLGDFEKACLAEALLLSRLAN